MSGASGVGRSVADGGRASLSCAFVIGAINAAVVEHEHGIYELVFSCT